MDSLKFAASLLVASYLTAARIVVADTIILKSGEKIDGRVVSETDTEVTVEYKASASITDSRTVAKSDIQKIEKQAPDELAYQALKDIRPGPNSLPAATYDRTIQALQAF